MPFRSNAPLGVQLHRTRNAPTGDTGRGVVSGEGET